MRTLPTGALFFTEAATTYFYTLSLHDALPIWAAPTVNAVPRTTAIMYGRPGARPRSEEHTSELQSHHDLVCRLLLEKKNKVGVTVPHRVYSCLRRHTIAP